MEIAVGMVLVQEEAAIGVQRLDIDDGDTVRYAPCCNNNKLL